MNERQVNSGIRSASRRAARRVRRGLAPYALLLPWLLGAGACQPRAAVGSAAHTAAHSDANEPLRCLSPEQPMATLQAHPEGGYPSAQCVEQAQALVQQMTPAEKFAQMMQPEWKTVRDISEVTRFGFGSVLSGGGSAPNKNTAFEWARLVNRFRSASLQGRLRIPLLWGVDAVHGHNNVHGAVIFPHNIGLGATRDPDLVRRIGEVTAKEVVATNVDWTFAPVLAVARDERWGRTYESFGEHPELVELLGPALIRGVQGERLGRAPNSVLACAKHYIGDGNTERGKDQGDSLLSEPLLREQLLPAYQKAIEAGVGSMMVSFSSVHGVKMHCHGPLLNDTLKRELGFNGFLVSDWQAVEQLPGNYPQQLAAAIQAGVDLIMAPAVHLEMIETLSRLVPQRVPMARIDDAVARILTAKCELGMFEPGAYPRDRSGELAMNAEQLGNFGTDEHRALAREAVQKSLVLLKNDGDLLPLDRSSVKVHLAGRAADDIGRQSGGWTINWQGQPGPITVGTTIRGGFEAALGAERVSYSRDGRGVPADGRVAIAVVGERPYAEYSGDRDDLHLSDEDLEVIRNLERQQLPVIVVLISGRPLILGQAHEWADALVAAWLPGSEGAGVSDVLLGDAPFVGKLPHSWPRSMDQIPINVGDEQYDPLYVYGYGLTNPAN